MAQAKRKAKAPVQPAPQPQEQGLEEKAAQVLVHEVDEFLREERLESFWQTWKFYIIGGIAAIFFVAIGYESTQWFNQQQANTAATSWGEITSGTVEESNSALSNLVADAPDGYRLLAGLELAQRFANNADYTAAAQVYSNLISSGLDQIWANYVQFQRGVVLLNSDIPAAREDFTALTNTAMSPLAHEQLAWLAENESNFIAAVAHYEQILEDVNSPATLRERANARLTLLNNQAQALQ